MSALSLPIRIRPNRARLLLYAGVLSAVEIALLSFFLDGWAEIALVLSAPTATPAFAAAMVVCVMVVGYCLLVAALAAASLPGAPFFYIEIDERCVTHRRLWDVRRRLLRDVDGWTFLIRRRMVVRHAVRFELRDYVVVTRPQGLNPRRVDAPGLFSEFHTAFFTPLFGDKADFARAFADLLGAAVEAARASRRPIVLDIPASLAAQAFELNPRTPASAPAREAKTKRPSAQEPARSPGRFPTNEDKAAYWRGQSIQAAKADDDSPYADHIDEQAYLYEQLAKRDRKRIAREKRERRSRTRRYETDDT